MIKSGDDYRCDGCGDVCISDWTDEEAEAEYVRAFGKPLDRAGAVTLCDDCYKRALMQIAQFENRQ